jgi:hypothetical protein
MGKIRLYMTYQDDRRAVFRLQAGENKFFSKTPKPLCTAGPASYSLSTEGSFETSGHAASWFERDVPHYLKFRSIFLTEMGRDSVVGIATLCGLDGPEFESRWGAKLSTPVQTGPGVHPVPCSMGTGSLSRG